MIDPQTIDLKSMPSVALEDRSKLPAISCIYFALDSCGTVQYIGRSVNLKRRWQAHHNQGNLEALDGVRIAYLDCPEDLLTEVEAALIAWFCPPLNGGKITYYSSPFVYVVRQIRVTVPDLLERIKSCREASGRSAQSLATEAGISTAYWYQIENGKRKYITEEVLRGIERSLGVSFDVDFEEVEP